MQVSVKKNKVDEIANGLYQESEKANTNKKRKVIERSLMLLALLGTIVALFLFGSLYDRFVQSATPKSMIYGTWVEQKVAHYATDKFVLSEQGVTVNGSVVATDFEFNGKFFEYKAGDVTHRFRMLNQDNTEMMLDSTAHYNPVFKLQGSNSKALR
ncbi:DUF2850 domain-containing protein [Vibrio sp. T187]|uniref:DUF2850 domain-containing protein n=1 Tax=Vibrio TaxID=662 RepID=UPI0010C94ED5|nr:MULTISPECIES: DUF2850 domain-containing protein [Vibrio]MBW3698005.1 DUF2850 domain-containing protein [Vibrio sp. T187]